MNKIIKNQKGFTLIETLVAVAIFAFAITGLIAITAGGVANTNFVKNKFTAGYLALEGAEMVHNIRDTVSISDPAGGWGSILTALENCISPEFCYIEPFTLDPADILQPIPCGNQGCPLLTYNQDTAQFNYGGSNGLDSFTSIFRRTITVEEVQPADSSDPDSEIRVTSTVDWTQGVKPHSVSYSYNLKNWTTP